MASNTLSLPRNSYRSFTPTFSSNINDKTTPGNIFMQRKPAFTDVKKGFYHYKFDSANNDGLPIKPSTLKSEKGFRTKKRRATTNIVFNLPKNNEVDPYVTASNWLPKFKAIALGHLARKRLKKLKEKHEAVGVIQRASNLQNDPWMKFFGDLKGLLQFPTAQDYRKIIRDCLNRIKLLNAERAYIENQLTNVDEMIEKSMDLSIKSCSHIEGHKSTNPFSEINSLNYTANSVCKEDEVIKNVIHLLPEMKDIVAYHIDSNGNLDSRVQLVYEKSDKLLQKIHEDCHLTKSLQDQLESLRNGYDLWEKDRLSQQKHITSLENDKSKLTEKNDNLEVELKDLRNIRKKLDNKLRDCENEINKLTEMKDDLIKQCEDLTEEAMQKSKKLEKVTEEKSRLRKQYDEKCEHFKYLQEMSQDIENNWNRDKTRMSDMKQTFLDQIKTLEEEISRVKEACRRELTDTNELNDTQARDILDLQSTIRRLEREKLGNIDNDDEEDGPSASCAKDQILELRLARLESDYDNCKEDLKASEETTRKAETKIAELNNTIMKYDQEKLELTKTLQRQKQQYQILDNKFSETELQLNRANREKNTAQQKYNQLLKRCQELEDQLISLNDTHKTKCQELKRKSRELDSIREDNTTLTKENGLLQMTIKTLETDMQEKIELTDRRIKNSEQEFSKKEQQKKIEKEELERRLYDNETQIDHLESKNQEIQQQLRRAKSRLKDAEDMIGDKEIVIAKLKDERKQLEDELSPTSTFSVNSFTLDRRQTSNGLGSVDESVYSQEPYERSYSTLPNSRSSRTTDDNQ